MIRNVTKHRYLNIIIILLLILLTACNSNSEPEDQLSGTLRIGCYDEDIFVNTYGNYLSQKYPNLSYEVIPYNFNSNEDINIQLEEYINRVGPDILILNSSQYKYLAENNMILDLNTYIKDDQFDIKNILTSVVEFIKNNGDGNLRGLSPTFHSSAIFFNKNLFDEFGIPYPQAGMSWDEVINLANRFPASTSNNEQFFALKGQAIDSPFKLLWEISRTNNLSFFEGDNKTFNITTDAWKDVFNMVDVEFKNKKVKMEKEDRTPTEKDNNKSLQEKDSFLNGKTAMALEGSYYLHNLQQFEPSVVSFEWDIIDAPIDPNNPDTNSNFNVSEIFSIPSSAKDPDLSWSIISYINGESFSKLLSGITWDLLSREEYIKNPNGYNISAFYSKEPANLPSLSNEEVPEKALVEIFGIINVELLKILNDEVTIDDGLQHIQKSAEATLLRY
ncbi:extracellular solute-binding protein [Paenibacillus alkalitolerans]|uniref:extracellular solute-binding protein n=1 Tax=Paenibacillus alkalitolerans TaxID=2799335 RepID=UPI0018F27A9F|nr:extracellular solute-binding protein [Paenibacillus alkalitolerans]